MIITVRLSEQGLRDLPEHTEEKFQFQKTKGSSEFLTEFSDEMFEEFLRDTNLITYKNHLKEYDDGDIVGDFEVKPEERI